MNLLFKISISYIYILWKRLRLKSRLFLSVFQMAGRVGHHPPPKKEKSAFFLQIGDLTLMQLIQDNKKNVLRPQKKSSMSKPAIKI